MAKIAVIGAGSWGTALAALLAENGHKVVLWSYRKDQVEELKKTRCNASKLPGMILPAEIQYTDDLKAAVSEQDLLVMAVPSTATRQTALNMRPWIKEGQRLVTVAKGIEEETLLTQCEILETILPMTKIGALSGPTHAEEVIRHLPTAIVSGSKDKQMALYVQELFMNENFRVYISPDLTGIEIGGSLKNVIALAAGMSDGLGFGDNTKAALITRGIREITALAVLMGAKKETLAGLTGIGDLIVTCQSEHSRNHRAGVYIGQGMSAKEAMDRVKMVVEGVYSAKAALALGKKYAIDLPIIEEVNAVLFDGRAARDAVCELMTRDRKSEIDCPTWN